MAGKVSAGDAITVAHGDEVVTGTTTPSAPTAGDVWVDTNTSAKPHIGVYDGTDFNSVWIGRLNVGEPTTEAAADGDLSIANDLIVDSGGGVVIGHTGQITEPVTGEFQILGLTEIASSIIIGRWGADANAPSVKFVKSRDPAIFDASYAIVSDNDLVGVFEFFPDDGVDLSTLAASFEAEVDDGSPAAGDIGMAFVWNLMPGGGGAIAEVMRLGADGSLTTTGGGSLTGTWTDLGTVSTIDINGGTIDGTTIGGGTAAVGTFTNLSGDNASVGGQEAVSGNRILIVDGNFTATGAATAVVLKVAGTIETSTTASWGATYGQFHPQGVTLNSTQGAGAFVSAIHARGPAITLNGETITEAAGIVSETLPTNATHNYTLLLGDRFAVNQSGGEDTIVYDGRSSDVAHGLTTGIATGHVTDAYEARRKLSPTLGGVIQIATSESGQAYSIAATAGGTVNSTHTQAAAAIVEINSRHHDGSNAIDAMTAEGNLFLVFTQNAAAQNRSVLILDEDGDLFLDAGSGTAVTVFHDQHDMALMHATNVALGRVQQGQYELSPVTQSYLAHAKKVMQDRRVIAFGTNTIAPNGRFDGTTVNVRNGMYFAWDLGFYVGTQVEKVDRRLQQVMDIIADHCKITKKGKRLLEGLGPAVTALAEVV